MKKMILAATVLGMVVMNAPSAKAGDREWATVGKVLTGVAAVSLIANAIDAHTHVAVSYNEPVYCAPPPAVVYAPAPRVVYAPPPRVVYHPPVVYRAPVRYAPRVINYRDRDYRDYRSDRADYDRGEHREGHRR